MSKSFLSIALYVALFAAFCAAEPNIFPKTSGGACIEGQTFVINSVQDLKTNIADLECIFSAGLAPDDIGLGFYYGTVLLHENSMAMAALAAPFYQGDYVVKTTCNQQTVFLGTLKVAGISVGTAPWAIAPFTEATDPFDAPIDPLKNNIVMDFRQNVQQMCPIEDQAALLNAKGFLPFRYSPVPVNCYVDIVRVVGKDIIDGSLILLAKGLNRDLATGWKTSLFYALKTFDPVVKPDFVAGTEIVNTVSFTYTHNGFIDTVTHFGGQGLKTFLSNVAEELGFALLSNPLTAAATIKGGGLTNGVTTLNLTPSALNRASSVLNLSPSSSTSIDPAILILLSLLGGLPGSADGLPLLGNLSGGGTELLPLLGGLGGAGGLPLLLGLGGLSAGGGAGGLTLLEGTTAGKLLEEVQRLRGAATRTTSFGESLKKSKREEN